MAYAAQFRKKLLSVQEEEGLANEDVAKRFGVGRNSVCQWKKNPLALCESQTKSRFPAFGKEELTR